MSNTERASPSAPHGAPPHVRSAGVRIFASTSEAPRARRSTDVTLLAFDLIVLVVLIIASRVASPAEQDALHLFDRLPGVFESLWQLLHDVTAVWAVGLIVLAAVAHRRLPLARDLVVAAAVGCGGAVLACRVAEHAWPSIIDALTASSGPPLFPALRLAIISAVVITASPHLGRPLRYAGRWVVAGGAFATVALGLASVGGAIGGLVIGSAAAAIVHLVFGSPGGRPSLRQVAAALDDLGVRATDLQPADLQPEGVWTVEATDVNGDRLTVKVYGRDAWDSQLVMSIWRGLWYRETNAALTVNRIQQVEHEAFLTLLAGSAGLPVPDVLAAGQSQSGDALLVLRVRGEVLGQRDDIDDALLGDLWSCLARAHAAGISPGQLDPQRLGRDPHGRAMLLDWVAGRTAPSPEQVLQDGAQLLVSTVLIAGEDRAIAAVVGALGPDGLVELLPYLQPASLSPSLRRMAREHGLDADDLRTRAAVETGVELPDLVKLRRVTLGSIVQAALLLLVATAMVNGLTSLDFASVADELRAMSKGLVVVALLLTQAARASGALSTLGASPVALPVGPVVELQFAIGYINMAVPSSAGRMAMVMRFYQRSGSTATTALAVGALDSFANFIVQVVLVAVTLLFDLGSLDLSLGDSLDDLSSQLLRLVVVVVAVLVVAAAISLLFSSVRRRVLPPVRQFLDGLSVLRSPSKVMLLFGGNTLTQVTYALALGTCVQATGFEVGLVDLLLIINLVGTLASVIPVPNGMGVSEAGLTAGLVAAGVPEASAFAAVLTYRVLSAYLPPVWGFFAMRSLERQRYL